jgi:hypothetical protein
MNSLPYVYAALLDVLGYRELLNRDIKRGALNFKTTLQDALACLAEINDAEFAYQAISDTVIITCGDRSRFLEFLGVVKKVQLGFLSAGLFLRGGIAFQQHFRSGAVTYSPAFAAAYELETKTAIYPRVIIDHNIIEMLESNGEASPIAESNLVCERNGIFFLNILDVDNWQSVYIQAKGVFVSDSKALFRNEAVFLKHLWFQDYVLSSPFATKDCISYIPTIGIWKKQD